MVTIVEVRKTPILVDVTYLHPVTGGLYSLQLRPEELDRLVTEQESLAAEIEALRLAREALRGLRPGIPVVVER